MSREVILVVSVSSLWKRNFSKVAPFVAPKVVSKMRANTILFIVIVVFVMLLSLQIYVKKAVFPTIMSVGFGLFVF